MPVYMAILNDSSSRDIIALKEHPIKRCLLELYWKGEAHFPLDEHVFACSVVKVVMDYAYPVILVEMYLFLSVNVSGGFRLTNYSRHYYRRIGEDAPSIVWLHVASFPFYGDGHTTPP